MSPVEIIETPAGPAHVRRTSRKTLAISVLPDGSLELIAPHGATIEAIVAKVTRRVTWITRQRRAFRMMNAMRPPLRYVSGATHRYLGRQYRLKIVAGPAPRVAMRGGYITIVLPVPADEAVGAALWEWYRSRAREQFTRRVAAWEPWCRTHRLTPPRMSLRSMSKRWGSARRDGTIALNPELIRAPSACVDYVITHEICHLKHPDHGPGFTRLLAQLCPGWRKLKARLEQAEM